MGLAMQNGNTFAAEGEAALQRLQHVGKAQLGMGPSPHAPAVLAQFLGRCFGAGG